MEGEVLHIYLFLALHEAKKTPSASWSATGLLLHEFSTPLPQDYGVGEMDQPHLHAIRRDLYKIFPQHRLLSHPSWEGHIMMTII